MPGGKTPKGRDGKSFDELLAEEKKRWLALKELLEKVELGQDEKIKTIALQEEKSRDLEVFPQTESSRTETAEEKSAKISMLKNIVFERKALLLKLRERQDSSHVSAKSLPIPIGPTLRAVTSQPKSRKRLQLKGLKLSRIKLPARFSDLRKSVSKEGPIAVATPTQPSDKPAQASSATPSVSFFIKRDHAVRKDVLNTRQALRSDLEEILKKLAKLCDGEKIRIRKDHSPSEKLFFFEATKGAGSGRFIAKLVQPKFRKTKGKMKVNIFLSTDYCNQEEFINAFANFIELHKIEDSKVTWKGFCNIEENLFAAALHGIRIKRDPGVVPTAMTTVVPMQQEVVASTVNDTQAFDDLSSLASADEMGPPDDIKDLLGKMKKPALTEATIKASSTQGSLGSPKASAKANGSHGEADGIELQAMTKKVPVDMRMLQENVAMLAQQLSGIQNVLTLASISAVAVDSAATADKPPFIATIVKDDSVKTDDEAFTPILSVATQESSRFLSFSTFFRKANRLSVAPTTLEDLAVLTPMASAETTENAWENILNSSKSFEEINKNFMITKGSSDDILDVKKKDIVVVIIKKHEKSTPDGREGVSASASTANPEKDTVEAQLHAIWIAKIDDVQDNKVVISGCDDNLPLAFEYYVGCMMRGLDPQLAESTEKRIKENDALGAMYRIFQSQKAACIDAYKPMKSDQKRLLELKLKSNPLSPAEVKEKKLVKERIKQAEKKRKPVLKLVLKSKKTLDVELKKEAKRKTHRKRP